MHTLCQYMDPTKSMQNQVDSTMPFVTLTVSLGCVLIVRMLPYFQEEMMVQEDPTRLEKTMA